MHPYRYTTHLLTYGRINRSSITPFVSAQFAASARAVCLASQKGILMLYIASHYWEHVTCNGQCLGLVIVEIGVLMYLGALLCDI